MSQPVDLSDELVTDAALAAESANRSVSGQIELWAVLGRAIEPLLSVEGSQSLERICSDAVSPVSTALSSVDSEEGRARLSAYLNSRPYPHYERAPDSPNLLIRIEKDGTRTRGHFVGRKFCAVP